MAPRGGHLRCRAPRHVLRKSIEKGVGDRDIAVTFGGITFNPGEYPYSDADGVLVSSKPLC
ncbi:MAG: hypothetical protein IPP03_08865 [Dechloromonas sp.]|nr:hypothetical protein [Candidatus Dechloromonas phosphoritropha]MBP8789283.1 hypothetical protein [Azonexus sp.]MBP9229550.1 hypothetical protein [Azonexus sp.]